VKSKSTKERIMSTPYAFVARMEAKPEKAEELAALLTGALPLAEAEPGTVDWYAARTSATTFWIFDTFGSEDARQAHINGEIAAALMANADELLAAPPEILPADVLAAK
jgi:quinol monooxygenase YgiN